MPAILPAARTISHRYELKLLPEPAPERKMQAIQSNLTAAKG